ncbi:MAG: cupredoxin domain-containing protein [Actinomycetota bacterium]
MRKGRAGGLAIVLTLVTAVLWPAGTAMAGGGCHTGASQGEGDRVEMAKACFTPSVLRVDPGAEVTFINNDPVTHNVSATGWGTGEDLQEGDSFTATFAEEGTFPYACMYHYGMTGAIVVGDGTGPASGAPVEVGSVVDTTPISQQRADSVTASTRDDSRALGWAVAGGIGLLLGAVLSGMVLRRRREG